MSGASAPTARIRGLNQASGGPGIGGTIGTTDSVAQTSFSGTTPAYVQWYGFGRQEELFVSASTTGIPLIYNLTLSSQQVMPIAGPGLPAGTVVVTTIGQGHTTNTDLWLYDENLVPIVGAGNNDESILGGGTGTTTQSRLVRSLVPGTYYLAVSDSNLANDLASPGDDDVQNGVVLDFPDAIVNSSTATSRNVSLSINGIAVSATKVDRFDVVWVQFTVGVGGACIAPDGTCAVVFAADCTGAYQGNGTVCPPTGACLAINGDCTVRSQANCAFVGGTYQGDTSSCPPSGACIAPNGDCTIGNFVNCDFVGGTFHGAGTVCPGTGACCLGNTCTVLNSFQCSFQGGVLVVGACAACTCEGGGADINQNGIADSCERTLFVNAGATGTGTGETWADAFTDLQPGLAAAAIPSNGVTQMWVAAGTYYAGPIGSPVSSRFQVVNGVALYGGFAGGESTLSARNPQENVTTLSGDLDRDGALDEENAQTVVAAASGLSSATVLDGFVVTQGNGVGMSCSSNAMRIRGCRFQAISGTSMSVSGSSAASIEWCTFQGGAGAAVRGGGHYSDCTITQHTITAVLAQGTDNLEFTRCTFSQNSGFQGGAVMAIGGTATFVDCVFSENSATVGGAVFANGDAAFTDCQFLNNSASDDGGAAVLFNDDITVAGCTFSGNTAGFRGGAVFFGGGGGTRVDATDCQFASNSAGISGGAVQVHVVCNLTNCTFTGNSAVQRGGAIGMYFTEQGSTSGFLTITGGTMSGNTAPTGGALHAQKPFSGQGTIIFSGATIASNNSADGFAVAIDPLLTVNTVRLHSSSVDGLSTHGRLHIGSTDLTASSVTINGPLSLGPTAKLNIDVAGPGANQFDALTIAGTAMLRGDVTVRFVGGFEPAPSDSFQVLTAAAGLFNQFDVIYFPALTAPSLQDRFLRAQYAGLRGPGPGIVTINLGDLTGGVGFDDPQAVSTGDGPTAAAIGDLDRDGDPDLVLALPGTPASQPGSALILFNQGGTGAAWQGFTPPGAGSIQLPVGVNPQSIAIADFDSGNGDDLAIANAGDNTIGLLIQQAAAGTFAAPVAPLAVGNEPVSVAAADMDLDLRPDLLVASAGGAAASGSITLLRNETSGAIVFIPIDVPTPAPRKPRAIRPFNPDNDKDLDVVFAGPDGAAGFVSFITNGSGTGGSPPPLFVAPSIHLTIPVGAGPVRAAAAAFVPGFIQGRHQDVLLVNNGPSANDDGVSVLLNTNPPGAIDSLSFAPPSFLSLNDGASFQTDPSAIAAVDLDGDADLDAAVLARPAAGADRVVKVLRNDSTNLSGNSPQLAFALLPDINAGTAAFELLAADVDADGRRDLVAVGSTLLRGPGNGASTLRNTDAFVAPPTGACCDGAVCLVVASTFCTGPNRQFIGAGAACNEAGVLWTPCCRADFDHVGGLTIGDIFLYLAAWFAGSPSADFNGDSAHTIGEIFVFLAAWFAGCS